MIDQYRKRFNEHFSQKSYQDFLAKVVEGYPAISIRFAETPVFIPEDLKNQLIAAGEEIIKVIRKPNFKELTAAAIPTEWMVPDENDHPHFMVFDFGICKDENERIVPKLIELQGFPSLFGLQADLANAYKSVFALDSGLSPFFNGINESQYYDLLGKVIIGPYQPEETVLMDVDATAQKTAIDFFITQKNLGIPVLGLTDIFKENSKLFYVKEGRKIQIKRIYNRLIFDEVANRQDLFKQSFDPREPLDVEWITHPNWFYRISKYTLPLLKNDFVPETQFLNTVHTLPTDLENYVLKPLFSFAGRGVIIDLRKEDIDAIDDPQNWILQRKVVYEPVIRSPEGLVKAEIRLMYLWPDGEEPQLCINMARMSRGKMIGVNYNDQLSWVGGTVGLMEARRAEQYPY